MDGVLLTCHVIRYQSVQIRVNWAVQMIFFLIEVTFLIA